MITFIRGNIFESDCEALVNTVNCDGVMGRGLALQFKQRFPEMFNDYVEACKTGKVRIGAIHVWKNPKEPPKWILNFPTKHHWRNPSKLLWIRKGLESLARTIHEKSIQSIAVPPLGCGLGGLNWDQVSNEIKKAHDNLFPLTSVIVYIP